MLVDGASVGMYFQLMHGYCPTNKCGILLLERQNATEVTPFANKTIISYVTRHVIRIPQVSPKVDVISYITRHVIRIPLVSPNVDVINYITCHVIRIPLVSPKVDIINYIIRRVIRIPLVSPKVDVINYITRHVNRIPLVSPKSWSKLRCHEQHQNAQLGVKGLKG